MLNVGALIVVGVDHQHGVPQQQYRKYHKAAGRSLAQRHAGRHSKAGIALRRVGSEQHPSGYQHHAGVAGVFQVVHSAAGRSQAAPHKAQQQPQVSQPQKRRSSGQSPAGLHPGTAQI